MSSYQLPPLKNEKIFEEFVCDLFNEIENTKDYCNTDFQTFGVRGQQQKGIDVFSPGTKTVIQCKVKDIRKKDDLTRSTLQQDFETDLESAFRLGFEFDRFILTSTFRDDANLQEYATKLQEQIPKKINIYYWGWDTLSRYAEQHENIIKKYFPRFAPKTKRTPKVVPELPEGALGKDLLKKNYINYLIKRYGNWKQLELNRTGEEFNWASFNRHISNRYRATGINYIHIAHFSDMQTYLKDRIDKTIFGRNRKSNSQRNYSSFEEHTAGILD